MRWGVLITAICFSAVGLAQADDAKASMKRATSIPAQPLGSALEALASDLDLQVIYQSEVVGDRQTRGAAGELTPDEALKKLLEGSGLTYRYLTDKTVTIVPVERSHTAAGSSRFLGAGVVAAGAPEAAAAHTQDVPAVSKSAELELQEVSVVGTRIRGSKATDALPVSVFSSQQIQTTGAVSGDDLLRTIPQMGNVAFNPTNGPQTSNAARGDVNSIDLRGAGIGNTLVLLNGRRMVAYPTSQSQGGVPLISYNAESLPIASLERIEVLRDGAGAIYGSDAVAGVVNAVTRTHFDGLSVTNEYGGAEGTHLRQNTTTLFAGHNFGGGAGNISLALDLTERSAELSGDESYTATKDLRSSFADYPGYAGSSAADLRTNQSSWPALVALGVKGAVKQGTSALTTAAGSFHIQPNTLPGCLTQIGNSLCIGSGPVPYTGAADSLRYDSAQNNSVTDSPSIHRQIGQVNADYHLSSNLTVYGEADYYHSSSQEAQSCPDGVASGTACYAGQDRNGAYYWIAIPKQWNHVLVVHSHGGPSLEAPAPGDPTSDLRRFSVTVAEGFAWAGSSYRHAGYGVRDAAQDTDNLRQIFWSKFTRPKYTLLHGQSWGANVAAKTAELYGKDTSNKPVYDGVILTSGVLGGGTLSYDFRADLRVIYQYFCSNHPAPNEPAYPLWQGLPEDSQMTLRDLNARVNACTGVNLPEAARSATQKRALANIVAVLHIPERTLVAHLNWATFTFRDLVHRQLHGESPFSNIGVRYAGSADDSALNAGVERFAADPQGVRDLAFDSDLTGALTAPTLTLHAEDDPTAFVELESVFHDTVAGAGCEALLVQSFTDEHEHSKLATPEYAALFRAMMNWINRHQKATLAALAADCNNAQKIYGEGCHFDPKFHPRPLTTRVYRRVKQSVNQGS